MTDRAKKILSIVISFGLSAALLGWLFYKIDYKQIWDALKNADPGYLALAGLVFFGINFIIWLRWTILMKALNLKFNKFSSLRWFMVGIFCNLFPLTTVGGDVVKGLGLSKETGNKTKVFASIVLDRLIGFVGIVVLAFVAFWGGRVVLDDSSIMVSIVAMTLLLVGMGAVLFSQRVFTWSARIFKRWPVIKEALMKLHYDVVLLKGRQRRAFVSLGLSVLAQFLLAFDYYLIAKALHQDIHLFYFIIFSPLVCVASTLPSIGGLGIREFGWKTLLLKVGVAENVSVALGLTNFAFMVIFGLLAGIFYVSTLSVRRVQHHQTGS